MRFPGDDVGVSTPEPTEHAPGTDPALSPPAPSRYQMGTWPNLLRSLLVIGALMAFLVLMVPRVNSISGPPVDTAAVAADVASTSGWPIERAVGLPTGWTATSARYVRTGGGAMTWLAGYQAPSGNYVSVEQTMDASAEWIQTEINRGVDRGTVEVAGRTWTKYERSGKTQNSLVHEPAEAGELTTLVTGTGTFEELAVLAGHLEVVTP